LRRALPRVRHDRGRGGARGEGITGLIASQGEEHPMTDTTPLAELSREGVSIWLDDLSRERIVSGALQELMDTRHVVGVTTNPTIFANAVSAGDSYDEHVRELADAGTDVTAAVFDITTHDVQLACDIMRPLYDSTDGKDGRVSIEVEPGLAHDTA